MLTNIAKTAAKRINLQQIRLSHNASLQEIVANELKTIKSEGTFKVERAIVSRQGSDIQVEHEGSVTQEINLCANNYLGLSSHPKVIQKAKEYLESHGAGLSSVRFICGTQDIHNQLEKQISKFYGTEDTILYASCFDANAGIFEVLLKEQDAIISDALNHASIIDGIRLCKAKRYRYQNANMEDLERQLKLADENGARLKMIATDGVFSMDGRIAPLDQICDLAEKYNAIIFVDDCHATGFLGKTGRGTPELFGVQNRVHLVNSTLGKALGGASGGYTTGHKDIIALLRQRSRPYLFSNSLPPPVVGAASAALELVDAEPQLREQLWKNTRYFRDSLKAAGFNVKGDDHPIAPIMLGDARLAAEFSADMAKKGIYVIGFSYPVVPKDLARIRVQLSAAISDDQIKKAVEAFIDIGKTRNIIA
ncbi:2-amino-3-ketobutyrate coenzyme A ligase [Conidiobolus coronatus NRRL 28638]|uniref:2-amino-3-ketobutyrate coenzyme A ligase, mitochondrial n=1 Tax=Conidiobolus coronatus (strain ATCC 28846 / CBS 209.66 / NRRL 28638) TaxID=796925 RepID=A0A137PJ96_CONC2|nr:2-amino-3-ketobutyrate coenzyme A ligase [Conidiobolus coronatus NRRL 28638]|eukprot:KXN75050.1 2-amino-3-ketobutyrate coenzyme A ligase [Conidiobolus coronatus NRRL 28638]